MLAVTGAIDRELNLTQLYRAWNQANITETSSKDQIILNWHTGVTPSPEVVK